MTPDSKLGAWLARPLWQRRLGLLLGLVFFLVLAVPAILWAVVMLLTPRRDCERTMFMTIMAIDQVANAACGGSEDETISSRTGKHIYFAYVNGSSVSWHDRFIRAFTDWFEPQHVFIWMETDRGTRITFEQRNDAIALAKAGKL